MSAEADSTAAAAGLAPAIDVPVSGAAATAASAPEAVALEPRGPGSRLRAAREARQLGVQQVTDLLHIEPRLIAAMEADDFTAFDAPVYARGFLRKYATFLGLPETEIVAAYERLHAGPGAPTLIPPATAEEPRRDWTALKYVGAFAGVVVLVAGSYWWWLSGAPTGTPERAAGAASTVAASPAAAPAATATVTPAAVGEVAAGSSSDVTPGVPGTSGAEVASTVVAPSSTVPAPSPALGAASTASTQAGSLPAAATGSLGPPASLPSGAALEIDFVGECWVEVLGPSGDRLMYDLGRPGESRALPGPGPWRVSLGAADAARLRVSGRPVVVPAANRFGATARLVVRPDGTVQ
jgi:cytoskeleton protein RodZ